MSTRIDGITIGPGEMRHHGFTTTTYQYDCEACGKPGTDTYPNTKTHPGECRKAKKRENDAKAKRRKRAKR